MFAKNLSNQAPETSKCALKTITNKSMTMSRTLGETFVLPKTYTSLESIERVPSNQKVMRRYLKAPDSETSLAAATAGPSSSLDRFRMFNNTLNNSFSTAEPAQRSQLLLRQPPMY